MNDVNDMIGLIGQDDKAGSQSMFDDILKAKVSAALDAKRIEVASKLYGGDSAETEEELEDIEIEDIQDDDTDS
jgi:hypothetical protein